MNHETLANEMNNLKLGTNYTNLQMPQQYSSSAKKVAPVVPPKPNCLKSNAESSGAQPQVSIQSSATYSSGPIYTNVNSENDLPSPQIPPYGITKSSQNFSSAPPLPQTSYSPPTMPKYIMHPADSAPPNISTIETQSGYSMFRPESSASSYDANSIYEPINPINSRPPSQMSNRSNYSMGSSLYIYPSYYPNNRKNVETHKTSVNEAGETEVDRLTDLMMQNLENSGEPDFYGVCFKCGKEVLGEGSGCSTLDHHVYHIACFTCHVCHKELQGKPFYAKDGKPYCEEDYLNMLEKCCVCGKLILDRILRATGKAYHPNCFACVECGKCLDGVPFTVDAMNQIYSIDCFHKKFAPRCCICMEAIMPEAGKEETIRIVALDKSFHLQCYRCVDCGLRLSETENSCFPMDDSILCRSCNAKRVQALTSSIITEL